MGTSMPFNPDTPDGDVSIDKVSVVYCILHSFVCCDSYWLSMSKITTAALPIIQNIIIILMPNPYIFPTPSLLAPDGSYLHSSQQSALDSKNMHWRIGCRNSNNTVIE